MRDYFGDLPAIAYKGPETEDPLAFRWYDPDKVLLGKRMEEHLRMAVCYWHSFHWHGVDPFGNPTMDRPWADENSLEAAAMKMRAAFGFMEKLGAPFFTFHDKDIAPQGNSLRDYLDNHARLIELMGLEMERTGVKLLWGTANLTAHPRYMAGVSTSPDPEVFAWAAAQVKTVMEATYFLGGENYVLWGGREGYETILNTDMRREFDQMGRFLHMVVEHKHKIGFTGTILIEPKPHEPSKHQYDFDCAAVLALLRKLGLEKEIKLNIEANHATLAGHAFEHEIAYAIANDAFGSLDMNRGDPLLGWDTDQFPFHAQDVAVALYQIVKAGGFTTGGLNFDARIRRQSVDPTDLFHAHIGGMDVCARALEMAVAMVEDRGLEEFVDKRYSGWSGHLGRTILDGRATLDSLTDHLLETGIDPKPNSGRQEYLENYVNRHL